MTDDSLSLELIEMERMALSRWCQGDPSGFLQISAPDVVYFDPFRGRRIDGLPALTRIYQELRGKIFASAWDILNPLVQRIGDAAVLTYNFVSRNESDPPLRWNCTEVYRRDADGRWRILQTHWSFTYPPPAIPPQ
jgi:ketosteroid isomerase-like protein